MMNKDQVVFDESGINDKVLSTGLNGAGDGFRIDKLFVNFLKHAQCMHDTVDCMLARPGNRLIDLASTQQNTFKIIRRIYETHRPIVHVSSIGVRTIPACVSDIAVRAAWAESSFTKIALVEQNQKIALSGIRQLQHIPLSESRVNYTNITNNDLWRVVIFWPQSHPAVRMISSLMDRGGLSNALNRMATGTCHPLDRQGSPSSVPRFLNNRFPVIVQKNAVNLTGNAVRPLYVPRTYATNLSSGVPAAVKDQAYAPKAVSIESDSAEINRPASSPAPEDKPEIVGGNSPGHNPSSHHESPFRHSVTRDHWAFFPFNLILMIFIGYTGFNAFQIIRDASAVSIDPSMQNPAVVQALAQEKIPERPLSAYQTIWQNDLFHSPEVSKTKATEKVALEDIASANTTLGIILVGTVVANDADLRRAIIANESTRQQNVYREGDKAGNVWVKEIFREKVIIGTDDGDRLLSVDYEKGHRKSLGNGTEPEEESFKNIPPVHKRKISRRRRPPRIRALEEEQD